MRYTTLEKLLKTRFNVIALENRQASAILDTFRQYSSINGTPVYVWKKDFGLYRLNMPNVIIPNTKTVQQILNYIIKYKQSGIFILKDFSEPLSNAFNESSLLNIAKAEQKMPKVFLLDNQLDLSDKFRGHALETKKMLKMKMQRAA